MNHQMGMCVSYTWLQGALQKQSKPVEAMFCWKTSVPVIHVDITLTRAIYLSTVADHVQLLIETVLPGGSGLFQQDVPCKKAKMLQEWFEEHDNESEVLTLPSNSPDLNPVSVCEMCWTQV